MSTGRRELLKKASLLGGVTIIGTPVASRVVTTTGPIEVRVFFTEEMYTSLGDNIDSFIQTLESYFHKTITSSLDLSVSISYRDSPVSLFSEDATRLKNITGFDRRLRLQEWSKYHIKQDFETATHANILIGKIDASVQGVGSLPVLPSCCVDIQNFSVVWDPLDHWPTSTYLEDYFFRMVLHEIGHNLGLTHAHGCNFENGNRSIMLTPMYARNVGYNLFGDKISPAIYDEIKFNSKINKHHLSL